VEQLDHNKESNDTTLVLYKSNTGISGIQDQLKEIKVKSLIRYNKSKPGPEKLAKEKSQKTMSLLKYMSFDASDTESASRIVKKDSDMMTIRKGLISTFITSDPIEYRPMDKFNFVDCLAVDTLYRTYNTNETQEKENEMSKIQIGRAKYIFEKTKKPKKKENVTMFDFSKEINLKKDNYINERKQKVIVLVKPNLFRMHNKFNKD
jgi:hypothetical protein